MKRRAKKITSLPLKFRNKLTLPDRPTRPIIVRNMKTDGAIWTNDPTAAEVSRAQKSISTLKNMGFNLSADATREIFQRMTGRTSAPGYIMPDEERRMRRMAELMGLHSGNQRKNDGAAVTVNEYTGQPVTAPDALGPSITATMAMINKRRKTWSKAAQLYKNATPGVVTHVIVPSSGTTITFPTTTGRPNAPDMHAGERAERAGVVNTTGTRDINAALQGDEAATDAHMTRIVEGAKGNQDMAAANQLTVKPVTFNVYTSTQPMDQYHGLDPDDVFEIRMALENDKSKYEEMKNQVITYYRLVHNGEDPTAKELTDILAMAEPTTTEKTGTIGVDLPRSRINAERAAANERLAEKQSGIVSEAEKARRRRHELTTDVSSASETESDTVRKSTRPPIVMPPMTQPQPRDRSNSKSKPPSKPRSDSKSKPASKPQSQTQGRPRSDSKSKTQSLPKSLTYPKPQTNTQSKQQQPSTRNSFWARPANK